MSEESKDQEQLAGEMSFWDHLEVLRGTLFRSILYVCLAAVVCFSLKDLMFKVVFYPADADFFLYRFLHWKVNVNLINTDVVAQFFVHLKVACLVGLVLVFPLVIWEIWKFIAPALYEKEKKICRSMASASRHVASAAWAKGSTAKCPLPWTDENWQEPERK